MYSFLSFAMYEGMLEGRVKWVLSTITFIIKEMKTKTDNGIFFFNYQFCSKNFFIKLTSVLKTQGTSHSNSGRN